jgi:polysaccharide pyruvyl transferase WcaK-like protein
MARALIVNAYATGNWGDAAIVESMVESLRASGFDSIAIAPVDWRTGADLWQRMGIDDVVPPIASFFDVPQVIRRVRPAMLTYTLARYLRHRVARAAQDPAMRAYRQADLVCSAGGGYLGGSRAGPNLIKLINIRAGTDIGRPTIVAPVTVNPHGGSVGRVLRWGLQGATTFVRDRPSLAELANLGVPATLVPDLALRAPSLRRVAAESDPARPATDTIGWAPRGYRAEHQAWGSPDNVQRRTLEAVRRILAGSGKRLRFVPHVRAEGRDDDLEAIEGLLTEFGPEESARIEVASHPTTIESAVRQYASLDVLVTSRMHAAIFAMAAGTPAMTIGYEPKVAGVMSEVGLSERVVRVDTDPSVDDLVALVDRLGQPAERAATVAAYRDVQDRFEPFHRSLAQARAAA